jgi:antirestriction protein ArdC
MLIQADIGPTMLYSRSLKRSDYAASPRRFYRVPNGNAVRRGITLGAALWALCRCRHKAHSTGHAKRLHRENFDNPVSFGSESYSKEELIAEMTAAMLCGIAGIEQRILENSAAYLKTWIARLKSDSRLLVSAASQAQKAADFIQGKAPHQLAEA